MSSQQNIVNWPAPIIAPAQGSASSPESLALVVLPIAGGVRGATGTGAQRGVGLVPQRGSALPTPPQLSLPPLALTQTPSQPPLPSLVPRWLREYGQAPAMPATLNAPQFVLPGLVRTQVQSPLAPSATSVSAPSLTSANALVPFSPQGYSVTNPTATIVPAYLAQQPTPFLSSPSPLPGLPPLPPPPLFQPQALAPLPVLNQYGSAQIAQQGSALAQTTPLSLPPSSSLAPSPSPTSTPRRVVVPEYLRRAYQGGEPNTPGPVSLPNRSVAPGSRAPPLSLLLPPSPLQPQPQLQSQPTLAIQAQTQQTLPQVSTPQPLPTTQAPAPVLPAIPQVTPTGNAAAPSLSIPSYVIDTPNGPIDERVFEQEFVLDGYNGAAMLTGATNETELNGIISQASRITPYAGTINPYAVGPNIEKVSALGIPLDGSATSVQAVEASYAVAISELMVAPFSSDPQFLAAVGARPIYLPPSAFQYWSSLETRARDDWTLGIASVSVANAGSRGVDRNTALMIAGREVNTAAFTNGLGELIRADPDPITGARVTVEEFVAFDYPVAIQVLRIDPGAPPLSVFGVMAGPSQPGIVDAVTGTSVAEDPDARVGLYTVAPFDVFRDIDAVYREPGNGIASVPTAGLTCIAKYAPVALSVVLEPISSRDETGSVSGSGGPEPPYDVLEGEARSLMRFCHRVVQVGQLVVIPGRTIAFRVAAIVALARSGSNALGNADRIDYAVPRLVAAASIAIDATYVRIVDTVDRTALPGLYDSLQLYCDAPGTLPTTGSVPESLLAALASAESNFLQERGVGAGEAGRQGTAASNGASSSSSNKPVRTPIPSRFSTIVGDVGPEIVAEIIRTLTVVPYIVPSASATPAFAENLRASPVSEREIEHWRTVGLYNNQLTTRGPARVPGIEVIDSNNNNGGNRRLLRWSYQRRRWYDLEPRASGGGFAPSYSDSQVAAILSAPGSRYSAWLTHGIDVTPIAIAEPPRTTSTITSTIAGAGTNTTNRINLSANDYVQRQRTRQQSRPVDAATIERISECFDSLSVSASQMDPVALSRWYLACVVRGLPQNFFFSEGDGVRPDDVVDALDEWLDVFANSRDPGSDVREDDYYALIDMIEKVIVEAYPGCETTPLTVPLSMNGEAVIGSAYHSLLSDSVLGDRYRVLLPSRQRLYALLAKWWVPVMIFGLPAPSADVMGALDAVARTKCGADLSTVIASDVTQQLNRPTRPASAMEPSSSTTFQRRRLD